MSEISVEKFRDKFDSLYRLVIVASRRATQVAKPDSRPLVPVRSKKATIVALEEILQGKVSYEIDASDEEDYVE
ncbi:MAG: DNA-directed RNA polymerase subunit omega [Candidatus Hydrogenedentes bacterium]|nr:DNA-directed RNA polymerase subunit omega [Candidatus Hydrogenedentota bacterium]